MIGLAAVVFVAALLGVVLGLGIVGFYRRWREQKRRTAAARRIGKRLR